MSQPVDLKGNVPNPYVRLVEYGDELLHGATDGASDKKSHEVDVMAWTDLIEQMLRAKASGDCAISQTIHAANKSVNFAIRGLTHKDVQTISGETRAWLPTGCEFRVGDATADSSRAMRVARPPKKEYFIKVTERAQANLEWRRKMFKRWVRLDVIVLVLALIAMIASSIALYKHGEGHRDPFGTLAEVASRALQNKGPVSAGHVHK